MWRCSEVLQLRGTKAVSKGTSLGVAAAQRACS
jgi:hypothetical protein